MIYKGYEIEESPMGGFPVYYKSEYCFVGETLTEAKELVDEEILKVQEKVVKDMEKDPSLKEFAKDISKLNDKQFAILVNAFSSFDHHKDGI
tara:strand:+ start:864 stop:1139 length:276 start_codon:yes stop_codon:yes gene_type:complete